MQEVPPGLGALRLFVATAWEQYEPTLDGLGKQPARPLKAMLQVYGIAWGKPPGHGFLRDGKRQPYRCEVLLVIDSTDQACIIDGTE